MSTEIRLADVVWAVREQLQEAYDNGKHAPMLEYKSVKITTSVSVTRESGNSGLLKILALEVGGTRSRTAGNVATIEVEFVPYAGPVPANPEAPIAGGKGTRKTGGGRPRKKVVNI